MSTIVGTRPSGRLHLGHYASVIKPAIKRDATVLIAEYHSPLSSGSFALRDELVKHGVPYDNIVLQRNKFDGKLFFSLLEYTPSGLLKHMPQYKAKDKNALMFIYPALMAHDIVGYDYVVVGDDQKPHIEFARDILPKMGLDCPEPIYDGGRIMDLRHPENKMSKSEPSSCLFLDDDEYKKKIMRAVTTPEGLENLENIYRLLTGMSNKGQLTYNSNQSLKEAIIDEYEAKFRGQKA